MDIAMPCRTPLKVSGKTTQRYMKFISALCFGLYRFNPRYAKIIVKKDAIENLMGLCRDKHTDAHLSKISKAELQEVLLHNGMRLDEVPVAYAEIMGYPKNWTELPFLNGEKNQ